MSCRDYRNMASYWTPKPCRGGLADAESIRNSMRWLEVEVVVAADFTRRRLATFLQSKPVAASRQNGDLARSSKQAKRTGSREQASHPWMRDNLSGGGADAKPDPWGRQGVTGSRQVECKGSTHAPFRLSEKVGWPVSKRPSTCRKWVGHFPTFKSRQKQRGPASRQSSINC
jgi:hypothetical protein